MNTENQIQDEARWEAVLARDAAWDGRFVYGVRSTGIYCRPTCPSRRPRREQVTFFDGYDDAEKKGFRACKRCRPADTHSPAVELAAQARKIIEAAAADGQPVPTLQALGKQLSVSPYHLQRTFRAVMGMSPRQFAAAQRAVQMKNNLRDGKPVTQSLYEAGYGSPSRLYETSAEAFGMTPGAYRRGGAGMRITYTIIETPQPFGGCLLLAATQHGICSVQFGDHPEQLEAGLAAEFPHADRVRNDAALAQWVDLLRSHLTGRQPALNLPLDLQGTAFQQRVWAELRRIPYGQTRSYTQIAEAIQQPSAVRAVARACATNPAALVVPCHRVVRTDGSLAGYRWGIARKRALLEREAA